MLNFYDGNQGISYPFLDGSSMAFIVDQTGAAFSLPDRVIADFGSVLGVAVQYSMVSDTIYLYRIARDADELTFTFRSTCDDLAAYELRFVVGETAERFSLQYSYGETIDSLDSAAQLDLTWTGYLVIGEIDMLFAALSSGQSMTSATGPVVEPCCVQSLYSSYVRSINLANYNRLRVTPAEGCGSISPYEESVIVNARDIIGEPGLIEGYNCFIELNSSTNTIVIGADVGSGAGEPCEEVPLFAGESYEDSDLLTGGPKCKDTITSINGVSAESVNVEAGQGVRVYVDSEDPSHLIVSIGLYDLIVCGTEP
jgi:hypothetical protein